MKFESKYNYKSVENHKFNQKTTLESQFKNQIYYSTKTTRSIRN